MPHHVSRRKLCSSWPTFNTQMPKVLIAETQGVSILSGKHPHSKNLCFYVFPATSNTLCSKLGALFHWACNFTCASQLNPVRQAAKEEGLGGLLEVISAHPYQQCCYQSCFNHTLHCVCCKATALESSSIAEEKEIADIILQTHILRQFAQGLCETTSPVRYQIALANVHNRSLPMANHTVIILVATAATSCKLLLLLLIGP